MSFISVKGVIDRFAEKVKVVYNVVMKIKKQTKKYTQHRVYEETGNKLLKLSKKSGLYIIEILASLVDREYQSVFDK